jgi:hypothetical protein
VAAARSCRLYGPRPGLAVDLTRKQRAEILMQRFELDYFESEITVEREREILAPIPSP